MIMRLQPVNIFGGTKYKWHPLMQIMRGNVQDRPHAIAGTAAGLFDQHRDGRGFIDSLSRPAS